jgi:hypothetical protein
MKSTIAGYIPINALIPNITSTPGFGVYSAHSVPEK